ncbi:hypothetical protein MIDIC_240002 [Alphaproteobacteria bacterium]
MGLGIPFFCLFLSAKRRQSLDFFRNLRIAMLYQIIFITLTLLRYRIRA